MNHDRISTRLPELAAGELSRRLTAQMTEHVAGCEECAEWLRTYRLVAYTLAPDAGAESHPASDEVARCALEPEALPAGERSRIEDHLAFCSSCGGEARLVRRAAGNARSNAWRSGLAAFRRPALAPATRRLLVAAAAVLIVVALAIVAKQPVPGGEVLEIANQTLSGRQSFEAGRAIIVTSVEIGSGGEIDFRAEDAVVLGEDFSVGSGAEFSVEIGGENNEREEINSSSKKGERG